MQQQMRNAQEIQQNLLIAIQSNEELNKINSDIKHSLNVTISNSNKKEQEISLLKGRLDSSIIETGKLRAEIHELRCPNGQNLVGKFPLMSELVLNYNYTVSNLIDYILENPLFENLSNGEVAIFSNGIINLCYDFVQNIIRNRKIVIESALLEIKDVSIVKFVDDYLKNYHETMLTKLVVMETIWGQLANLNCNNLSEFFFTQQNISLPLQFWDLLKSDENDKLKKLITEICSLSFKLQLSQPSLQLYSPLTTEEVEYNPSFHQWSFGCSGSKYKFVSIPSLINAENGSIEVKSKVVI